MLFYHVSVERKSGPKNVEMLENERKWQPKINLYGKPLNGKVFGSKLKKIHLQIDCKLAPTDNFAQKAKKNKKHIKTANKSWQ